MSPEFFREPTLEEKKDFRVIQGTQQENPKEIFRKDLEKVEKEFLQGKRKPFCARCAKFDFKDAIDDKIKEAERKSGYVDINQLKVGKLDLNEYSDPDRFKLINVQEVLEPANAAKGTKAHMKKCYNYKCNVRQCGISIFDDGEKTKEMPDMSDRIPQKVESKSIRK